MLPEQAQKVILSTVSPGPEETLPVDEARRRVLARPVRAAQDLPAFPQSAVDGYALAAGGPVSGGERFQLKGVSRAGGGLPAALVHGEGMRIYTGAPVPGGTSVILMQEIARANGEHVEVLEAVAEGKFVRAAGSDVAAGEEALAAGDWLGPAALALLSAMGVARVAVHRAPRVALVASGDELCANPQELKAGQVMESTSHALRWALEEEALALDSVQFARDAAEAHVAALGQALESADFVIVTGGVSVGDFDLVRPALEELGVETIFWRVRQRPGGPLYFGRKGARFVFGLPGNPAATLVCFYEHVLPALRRFRGYRHPFLPRVSAALTREYRKPAEKTYFVRARLVANGGEYAVEPDSQQESHTLRSFAAAHALAIFPADVERFAAGTQIACDLLPGAPISMVERR